MRIAVTILMNIATPILNITTFINILKKIVVLLILLTRIVPTPQLSLISAI